MARRGFPSVGQRGAGSLRHWLLGAGGDGTTSSSLPVPGLSAKAVSSAKKQ